MGGLSASDGACVLWKNVVIQLRKSITVRSAKQAFDLLSARWPVSDGKAYIAALEACEGVDDGHVSDESALELFLLALKEAEIPYSTEIER
ncbi:DUF982 domain-containing protein [Rhizobium changzhiense]|uniref:DUF982 domain-containing protein n=1 Tax=Rhizobium changzhiense TaxID=2692317 RepID=UPI003CCE5D2D